MKTRNDFVSNSSSSSYIVVCKPGFTNDQIAFDIAEKTLGDESKPVKDFFNNYTCLTTSSVLVEWWDNDKSMIIDNSIAAGVCVEDDKLSKWFDENGDLKKDLVFEDVIKDFFWYDASSSDAYAENGKVVYESRVMGKINDKTVKMMSWLMTNAIEWYGRESVAGGSFKDCFKLEDIEIKLGLDKIKKALDEGKKLFLTRYSYEGDAQCYGHIYVYDTDGWKRSIGQKLKEDSKSVEIAWHVDE